MDEYLARLFGSQPSYMGQLMGADDAERLRQEAQRQGLLGTGIGLLMASGPSAQRQNIGQIVGQGLMAGQQAYRGAMQQAVQDRVTGLQLQQMQKQMQAEANLPEVLRAGIVRPVTSQQRELTDLERMEMRSPTVQELALGAPRLDVERLLSAAVSKGVPIDRALTAFKTIQGAIQPETKESGGILYERRPDGGWQAVAGKSTVTNIKRGDSLVVTDFNGNTRTVIAPTQQTGADENPFTPLITGGVLHPSVMQFATQLQRSFPNMDEDKTNANMARLTEMSNRAFERDQSRQDRAATTALSNQLVQLRIDELKVKQEQAKDGKPLPSPILSDLANKSENAVNLRSLANNFKDDYGGYRVDALGRGAIMLALRSDDPAKKDFGQWWQHYDLFANQIRNQLFGSALTKTEALAFEAAMITPGMSPTQIKANLQRQAEAAENGFKKIANASIAQGYSKSAIEALMPNIASQTPVGSEQTPVKVNSKAEYDRLPAGSVYMNPEGQILTKRR